MNHDLLQGFYLGDLLVEPGGGQIVGREGSTHLSSRAMEVLLHLASSPGELVPREELLHQAWGPGQGSRDALSHAIGDIRKALGDNPETPRFIQTLPRRGYRLIAPVRPLNKAQADGHGIPEPIRTPGSSTGLFDDLRQRGVLGTGLVYLLVGWLCIQVADIVFEQFGLPELAATLVTILVIAGFPIALLLSWFLEVREGRLVPHELTPRLSRRRQFSRTYLSIVGAVLIAGALVFFYDRNVGLPQGRPDESPAASATDSLPEIKQNSIAVLRLSNLDESEETAIFANGLADDVISLLSQVPGLLVSARGDSFTLDPNTPSSKVRERLRVAHYVEGSVQAENGAIRVVIQLIDSSTGFHIMARSFDRPLESYFAMRDEITALTVASLRPALPPETRATSGAVLSDPDIDVYMLYRRGIDASRRPDIQASIQEALDWFDAALEIDAGYAAAHAGKCDIHVEAYNHTNDASHIKLAEKACATALRLSPNLDVTYLSLGDLYTMTGRYELAEQAYSDALDIAPNNALALVGIAEVYRLEQRPEDAEASLRQAIGLHPGDWVTYNALGTFLFRSGRYSEAAEQYRNLVAMDDRNTRGLTNLASALMLAEQFDQAVPLFQRALQLEPSARTYTNLGLLMYNMGRYDEAVNALLHAVAMNEQSYLARSNLGDALTAAGRTEEAREAFFRARELAAEAAEVNRKSPFIMMDRAWIEAALDDHEEARRLIDRALDAVPEDPYVHYIDGLVHLGADDRAQALNALERAVALGYSTRLLASDPILAPLRRQARYRQLIENDE